MVDAFTPKESAKEMQLLPEASLAFHSREVSSDVLRSKRGVRSYHEKYSTVLINQDQRKTAHTVSLCGITLPDECLNEPQLEQGCRSLPSAPGG